VSKSSSHGPLFKAIRPIFQQLGETFPAAAVRWRRAITELWVAASTFQAPLAMAWRPGGSDLVNEKPHGQRIRERIALALHRGVENQVHCVVRWDSGPGPATALSRTARIGSLNQLGQGVETLAKPRCVGIDRRRWSRAGGPR